MGANRWREGWQEFTGNIELFRVVKMEEASEELQKDLKITSKVTGYTEETSATLVAQ